MCVEWRGALVEAVVYTSNIERHFVETVVEVYRGGLAGDVDGGDGDDGDGGVDGGAIGG